LRYFGFDLSAAMLAEATSRSSNVVFTHGDASQQFPFPDTTFDFAFAVDVIHHIDDVSRFFEEAHRTLVVGGELAIVTDSERTLRRRSLTEFFPEVLAIELARYPSTPSLHAAAVESGLVHVSEDEVTGKVTIDRDFLERLEAKCSSAMRLMEPAAHAAGMERVRAAGEEGRQWVSCYDVLLYARANIDPTRDRTRQVRDAPVGRVRRSCEEDLQESSSIGEFTICRELVEIQLGLRSLRSASTNALAFAADLPETIAVAARRHSP
jgi:SAM-dependent methyltransferase